VLGGAHPSTASRHTASSSRQSRAGDRVDLLGEQEAALCAVASPSLPPRRRETAPARPHRAGSAHRHERRRRLAEATPAGARDGHRTRQARERRIAAEQLVSARAGQDRLDAVAATAFDT